MEALEKVKNEDYFIKYSGSELDGFKYMGFDDSLKNCKKFFFNDATKVSVIKLDDPSYKEELNVIESKD